MSSTKRARAPLELEWVPIPSTGAAYDALASRTIDRAADGMLELRRFNNDRKRALITEAMLAAPAGSVRVLDIGCGRGGDVPKWREWPQVTLVGVDESGVSLAAARDTFGGVFIASDARRGSAVEYLAPFEGRRVDIVSTQMCLQVRGRSRTRTMTPPHPTPPHPTPAVLWRDAGRPGRLCSARRVPASASNGSVDRNLPLRGGATSTGG